MVSEKQDMKAPRMGVVGVGHIGKNHARLYAEIAPGQFTAIYDTDHAVAEQRAAARYVDENKLLIEMIEKTFLIRFKTPELGAQPVVAARAEVRGEHLLLLLSDGQLAAAFMLENIKSWFEVSTEEF